jgi:hypothetical protein
MFLMSPTESSEEPMITDKEISQLRKEAGMALPILAGPDPNAHKIAPVFDLDELRRRNAAKRIKGIVVSGR